MTKVKDQTAITVNTLTALNDMLEASQSKEGAKNIKDLIYELDNALFYLKLTCDEVLNAE